MNEQHLTDAVIDLARWLGIRTAHFRPARTEKGWRTAVAGDGKGFPDLVLVGARVMFVELKTDRGRVSTEQETWLAALVHAGQDVAVWYEQDWHSGAIRRQMEGIR